tara:strand:+ start:30746 stop:31237 length:492 start_codon:yes stop_codon:yes gene_type:complete
MVNLLLMNKSLLNKTLIVALLIIWALIGYKFFYGFSSTSEIPLQEIQIPAVNSALKKKDFELKLVDRDPFLGTYTTKPPPQVNTEKKIISNQKRNNTSWPLIEYFGFIQNETSKNPLVMLSVNNKLIRIKKGTEYEGLKIQDVFRDSISIKRGSQIKIFLKNK